jgi:hypothetical membrane protein
MAREQTMPTGGSLSAVSDSNSSLTRALLACGAVAGPLFVVVGLIQAFTIPGFDLRHQYLSLLSAGPLGWIQIANFVVAGLLTIAFAVGARQALRGGRMGTVRPLLIAGFGLGLVAAGVFVPDPALGFPPGTPDSIPKQISWHSLLHGVAAIVSFLFLFVACLVFAFRFARLRQWGWAAYSVATALVSFGLPEVPNPWGGVFLFTAAAVGFAWILALAVRLMKPDRD